MPAIRYSENPSSNTHPQIDNYNPCGYCKNKHSISLYNTSSISHKQFHLNRCLNCNAIFLCPRPLDEELKGIYDNSYYGQGDSKFSPTIERILDYFRSARVRKVSKYISSPAKVLDIGCGNGKFLAGLLNKGYECFGIELPGKSSERASAINGLNLKTGRLETGDFKDNFFDCICLWHVFEHLENPIEIMDIIKNIIKPEGYLFLSMPNVDSIQSRLFKGKWLHLDPPKHLFYFKPSDLVREMKKYGLSLIKQSFFSLEQNPFGIQQSLLNCILKKREVLFEALKGNKTYINDYSGICLGLQKFFYISTFPIFALLSAFEAIIKKGGTMEMIFQCHKVE